MWTLKDKYAIAGIGYTDFTKNSGRTVRALASEACLAAVNDAGLDLSEIDGFCSFNMGDSAPGIAVATELGIPDVQWAVDLYAGGNAANLIVSNAAAAIEAGMATNVLCFRAMNGRSGFRFGGGEQALTAAGPSQYSAPFGLMTYAQMMAMWCQRYRSKYGLTPEQLGTIATTFRDNATRNPRAMMRTPLSMDDYLASRMIVEPFRMYDICIESDGACAVLVTSAERARDLKQKPVYITSAVYGGGPNQGDDLSDLLRWPDHSHNAFKYLADDLWGAAGIAPKDLDFAQIYDCFTYSVLMALEGLGFCKEGEGGDWVQGGRIARGGEMPLNTNGGLLSEAYIHGFNHVIEAVQQLRGDAGDRQVPGAKIGLTTAGAMTCGGALILRN
ncbi:thiolase C-terminal domain-containing protein [Sphingomonas sp.]|uniref:thiolase C-terminal domain-containing protein n=1 Tax=Sphingomonas sp. TaxID=28214 RepID=UPI003D6CAF64